MNYLSIDIETTGTDWDKHTVIEFGAILEDTEKKLPFEELPKFNCLLKHPNYTGTPLALAMHKQIFEEIESNKPIPGCSIIPFYKLGTEFKKWLFEQNKNYQDKVVEMGLPGQLIITVAGKNFGTFDMRFLENLGGFKSEVWFRRRVIDPAALYFDSKVDLYLPDLKTCKERAGIKNSDIAHRTIQDAWDVIQVLRNKMY